MKAKYFKKLRAEVKYFQVDTTRGLFGDFEYSFKGETILARDHQEAALRANRRGIGRYHSLPDEHCRERWATFRVKELDKSDHWKNIQYFR